MKLRTLGPLASVLMCFSLEAQSFDITVNGFLTAAGGITDAGQVEKIDIVNFSKKNVNNFYGGLTNKADFGHDSILGLQINTDITDEISFIGQITADGQDSFEIQAQWAMLKYQATDKISLNAGRMRSPIFLLSEYLQVGYASPWVRPPIEPYSQVDFHNYNGLKAIYKDYFHDWNSTIQLFAGSANPNHLLPTQEQVNLDVKNYLGFDLALSNENLTMRLGYSAAKLTMESLGEEGDHLIDYVVNPCKEWLNYGYITTLGGSKNAFNSTCTIGGNTWNSAPGAAFAKKLRVNNSAASFLGIGYRYENENWVSIAEYTKVTFDSLSLKDSEGWYVMNGYRFGNWMPHFTVAGYRTLDDNKRTTAGLDYGAGFAANPATQGKSLEAFFDDILHDFRAKQMSYTFGVRWDIYPGVDLKLDYQRVHLKDSTLGLFSYEPEKNDIDVLMASWEIVF